MGRAQRRDASLGIPARISSSESSMIFDARPIFTIYTISLPGPGLNKSSDEYPGGPGFVALVKEIVARIAIRLSALPNLEDNDGNGMADCEDGLIPSSMLGQPTKQRSQVCMFRGRGCPATRHSEARSQMFPWRVYPWVQLLWFRYSY